MRQLEGIFCRLFPFKLLNKTNIVNYLRLFDFFLDIIMVVRRIVYFVNIVDIEVIIIIMVIFKCYFSGELIALS